MGVLHEQNINSEAIKELMVGGKPAEDLIVDKVIDMGGFYSQHSKLYDADGSVPVEPLKKFLMQLYVLCGINSGLAKKVDDTTKALIYACAYPTSIEPPVNEIPVSNGTIILDGTNYHFISEKHISPYRMNCSFDNEAPEPKRFLEWVNGLFAPEDIKGFQEIMGYLLLPTTKAQKAFFLIGTGGEGKSIWGWILENMWGNALTSIKIPSLQTHKFMVAEVEHKLVAYDDDLDQTAMKSTDVFKQIVTAKTKVKAEQKNKDLFEFLPYARLCACGNFALSSLTDTSDGFFRRLYVIKVKNKSKNRKDIRDFEEPMRAEFSGILLWSLRGLQRLIENGYEFSISERSKEEMNILKSESVNFSEFAEDKLEFGKEYRVSSDALYAAYLDYCRRNGQQSRNKKTFTSYFNSYSDEYNIKLSSNLGKKYGCVRGFIGMGLKSQVERGDSHE